MLNNLREYIDSKELKITILENRVNIINYDKLRDINDKEIVLTKDRKKIKILGKRLKLNKLIENEVLVLGLIEKVEFYE